MNAPLCSVCLLVAAACASVSPAPKPTSAALVQGPAPSQSVLGRVDRDFLDRVRAARALDHIKVGVTDEGEIWKVSIYHHDPEAVPKAALQHAPNPSGEPLMLESEWRHDGVTATQLSVRDARGLTCELSTDSQGKLLYRECAIETRHLPVAVLDCVHRILPEGQNLAAELREDAAGDLYEVQVEQGSVAHKLHIQPNGALVAHHVKVPAIFYYKMELDKAAASP